MKLKEWLKILIFVVACSVLIVGAGHFLSVLEPRDTCGMYGFYKEEENSIDVALIGQSTLFTSFFSPLAYKECGFTSFAIATSGLSGTAYPSAVRETLQRQNPKVWVIDVNGFSEEGDKDFFNTRMWIDNIAHGANRDLTIEELVPPSKLASYKFPFSMYHNNWQRIGGCFKTLIDKIEMNIRGYSVTKNFCAYRDYTEEDICSAEYDFSKEGMKSLEKFLSFLKDKKIKNVLFARFPHRNELTDGDSYKEGIEMIKSAGFAYKDFSSFEGMNCSTDFFDNEHVNIFGSQKITKVMAKYIDENYELKKDYSGETINRWETCVSYIPQIFAKVEEQTRNRVGQSSYTQRDFLK